MIDNFDEEFDLEQAQQKLDKEMNEEAFQEFKNMILEDEMDDFIFSDTLSQFAPALEKYINMLKNGKIKAVLNKERYKEFLISFSEILVSLKENNEIEISEHISELDPSQYSIYIKANSIEFNQTLLLSKALKRATMFTIDRTDGKVFIEIAFNDVAPLEILGGTDDEF